MSTQFPVLSGLGQDTYLCPIPFMLFPNDLKLAIRFASVLIFADDTQLFKSIKFPKDLLLLQSDINAFDDWVHRNGLDCNPNKCFIIRFGKSELGFSPDYTFSDLALQIVSFIKELVIGFDCE